MRTINANALAELQKEFGLESVLIVRVFWNDTTYVDYSDKREGLEDTGVQGKILEISGIDDIVPLDHGGNSISVNVTLDDSDGSIKDIINNIDVHKRKVQVLQWFAGRPLSDAFVIFTGQINTPMEWSEGNRTFKFSVLNMIENYELGFSLDEAFIPNLPVQIAGKAFPIVFGTALQVPALMVCEAPSGVLAQGFAWVYEDVYNEELDDLRFQAEAAYAQARLLFAEGVGGELIASFYNDGRPDPPDDYGTYQSWQQASEQAFQQADQFMLQYIDLNQRLTDLGLDLEAKKALQTTQPRIAALNYGLPGGFSPGQRDHYIVEMNGTRFAARFTPPIMQIVEEVVIENERPATPFFQGYQTTTTSRVTRTSKSKTKFKWFDAGTRIRVMDAPMPFIACLGANSQITAIWARAKGAKVIVPATYYRIENIAFTNERGFTAVAKLVTLNVPLTSILDADGQNIYDSDEIWCDIIGEVGSQFIDIMLYTIMMFSNLTVDPDSFGLVRTQTATAPMNFVIQDRLKTLDFIKDLCYQAKCAVWVKDRTVYLRYLSAESPSSGTITPEDLIEDSLVVTSTDSEDIITKIVAAWKSTFDQDSNNRIITRYNVARYGIIEEETNYFAYNYAPLVQRSSAFWVVRKGTVWKRIQFRTFVDKLIYETNDVITLSGFEEFFSCQDVKGIITGQSYDSSSNTVSFDVWLPIRWGEMCQTPYAYPSDQITIFGDPNIPEFASGNPFQNAEDEGAFGESIISSFRSPALRPPINTNPFDMQDTFTPVTPSTAVAYIPIDPIRPVGLGNANDRDDFELLDPEPIDSPEQDATDIGVVVGASEDGVYYDVMPVGRTTKVVAKQLKIAEGYVVPNDVPVIIVKKSGQWYMQAPTFVPET